MWPVNCVVNKMFSPPISAAGSIRSRPCCFCVREAFYHKMADFGPPPTRSHFIGYGCFFPLAIGCLQQVLLARALAQERSMKILCYCDSTHNNIGGQILLSKWKNGFFLESGRFWHTVKWILNICPWDFEKQYWLNPMGGFNQYCFSKSHGQILL